MRYLLDFLLPFLFALDIDGQQVLKAYDIVVAADGSGDFTTVQSAVNSTSGNGTILIKKGVYLEKLVIPASKAGIRLVGESRDSSVISNADYTGKPIPGGEANATFGTSTSYTVLVKAPDCRFENLTVENTAGRVGQAVALHVDGDRFIARNCRLLGNQDTLYAKDRKSRQYYANCYIEGTTDFIFGNSTVIFDRCTIHSKMNSYVTAAATPQDLQYGLVFRHCNLTAEPNVTKVYLGRPWRPYAATIFANSMLGAHIDPEGWHIWDGSVNHETARYAEFNNTGPGAGTASRVAWSRQLNSTEGSQLVPELIFGSDWDPRSDQWRAMIKLTSEMKLHG